MMEKVKRLENLKGTFVFDIVSEAPIRSSMLGKIQKSDLCDNLEIRGEHRIRVTTIYDDGNIERTQAIDQVDLENGWGELMVEEIRKDLDKLLHSCSRFLKIRAVHIFLT